MPIKSSKSTDGKCICGNIDMKAVKEKWGKDFPSVVTHNNYCVRVFGKKPV